MFAFNARVFRKNTPDSEFEVVDSRMGLTIIEVCEFAREIASQGVTRGTKLLIETLYNGENYQQHLDREMPGVIHGGFIFNSNALRSEHGGDLEERCGEFMEMARQLS